MKEEQSRKIALALLKAVTAKEVDEVMKSEPLFDDTNNWRPYGNREKNWDSVSAQTSDPVSAFGELIINSIDAILMKHAKTKGMNLEEISEETPKSMTEAVKMFYPSISEGKITTLSPVQKTELAEKCVLIGIDRAEGIDRTDEARKFPSYTIVDFGEGQNYDDFPRTFLSLGEKNKETIPFVQGRFNMGSTGSIIFCTRGDIFKKHYKLIISRRSWKGSDGNWGWTLIRVREGVRGEEFPVVEYFALDNNVPKFSGGDIQSFGRDDIGIVGAGTIVKLYEYAIGPGAYAVDLGLDNALNTNLLECALPVRIYDFGATPTGKSRLRKEGITGRTFSGMSEINNSDIKNIDKPTFQIFQTDEHALGTIRIYATGVKELPAHMKRYPYRCFYTVNGQAQTKEYASFFKRAKLEDLRDNLIVRIDCNGMSSTAKAAIFKPNKEQMNQVPLTHEMRKLLEGALQHGELKEYAREIRSRRTAEVIKDTEKGIELWRRIVRNYPEIGELFRPDSNTDERPIDEGGEGNKVYNGKKFPTFLKIIRPDGVLNLPINTYRYIECRTDVENEYLGRPIDPGELVWKSENNKLTHGAILRNGKLKIRVKPSPGAVIGESVSASFGFSDSNRPEPLMKNVSICFCAEEKTKTNKPGQTKDTTGKSHAPAHQFPKIVFVYEKDWGIYDFDSESGAKCIDGEEGFVIYVNGDNKYLKRQLEMEAKESERELTSDIFRFAVGIFTLSIYIKFDKKSKEEDPNFSNCDEHIKQASSAISAYVITLIKELGGRR